MASSGDGVGAPGVCDSDVHADEKKVSPSVVEEDEQVSSQGADGDGGGFNGDQPCTSDVVVKLQSPVKHTAELINVSEAEGNTDAALEEDASSLKLHPIDIEVIITEASSVESESSDAASEDGGDKQDEEEDGEVNAGEGSPPEESEEVAPSTCSLGSDGLADQEEMEECSEDVPLLQRGDKAETELKLMDGSPILSQAAAVENHTPERSAEGGSEADDAMAITAEPAPLFPVCPPGLDFLLETGQVVVHMGNLRQNLAVHPDAKTRMEVIDETRKVLFHVEQDPKPRGTDNAFMYQLYDREGREELMQVYSPHSSACVTCGASWQWLSRCNYQAMIFAPVGVVAGFVRRSQSFFVQEFEVLDAQEQVLLVLRGAPSDLEIYTPDLDGELGRLSVHGWHGVMHEVRRTGQDYGLTFPLDLDVKVKAVLVGAIFAIHWLYSTKGGKVK